jgi:hypothetical protein
LCFWWLPLRNGIVLALVAGIVLTAQVDSKSALRARILDDLTRAGVSGVRVSLTGGALKEPLVKTTDASGRFLFPDLPIGNYLLTLDKAGYFPESYGGINVGGPAVDLRDIILTAKRTILGTVRWNDGEPVPDAIVHVMTFRAGKLSRASFVAPVTTNERGAFSIDGLRPRRLAG